MPEPTKEQKETLEAVTALSDLVKDNHGKSAAEVKEISERIDGFLDEQETKNQKYLTDLM